MLDVCGEHGTCQNEVTNAVHGYCACDTNWSGPRCQNGESSNIDNFEYFCCQKAKHVKKYAQLFVYLK